MSANRPFVLTIAGFDPSAGAGVLADVKTFEQHHVFGFAINTGNTIQTENEFFEIQWTDVAFVLKSLEKLFENYKIRSVKIGIVPSLGYLKEIVSTIKKLSPKTQIVWDSVLKSSTNFNFLTIENQFTLIEILKNIDLITPNYNEISQLTVEKNSVKNAASMLSEFCPVLLKGGHNTEAIGTDFLYTKDAVFQLLPNKIITSQKHGSGCVLSAAITANLALEQDIKMACINAKKYIESFLQSNPTKLGYHHV